MAIDDDGYVTVRGFRIPRIDPEKVARNRARNRADEPPIVDELRRNGLRIDHISDLVNTTFDYREHLPLLVDLIGRCPNYKLRAMLVRAVTIPAARATDAPQVLVREFAEAPEEQETYRWAVGNALGTVATPDEAAAVVGLLRDRRYGTARQELARAVARLRPPGALDVLVEGLDDPDVAGHCVEALGLLGDRAAIPHLDRMTSHRKEWIAQEARTAKRRLARRRTP